MTHDEIEEKDCPICLAIKGVENEETWIVQSDSIYRDDVVMAFVSSKAIKGNEGHVLVVPVEHYDNLYDIPEDVLSQVTRLSKRIALALKQVREADGITLVQNNEPAGDQHAFHYHLHVIPRFEADHFHEELWKAERSTPEDRAGFAEALRAHLNV